MIETWSDCYKQAKSNSTQSKRIISLGLCTYTYLTQNLFIRSSSFHLTGCEKISESSNVFHSQWRHPRLSYEYWFTKRSWWSLSWNGHICGPIECKYNKEFSLFSKICKMSEKLPAVPILHLAEANWKEDRYSKTFIREREFYSGLFSRPL